jgi:predicted RNA-binding protein YlqC (UPF0109 family)
MEEKRLLETIIKSIVVYPEEVKVEHSVDQIGELLTLYVSDYDKPHIIGKEGMMIKALRKIIGFMGAKRDKKVTVVVFDLLRSQKKVELHKSRDFDDFGVQYAKA